MCKTSILKIFYPCLYIFTLSKYRQDPDTYPDPVKIFRIRPKRSGFGSGSAFLPDPDQHCFITWIQALILILDMFSSFHGFAILLAGAARLLCLPLRLPLSRQQYHCFTRVQRQVNSMLPDPLHHESGSSQQLQLRHYPTKISIKKMNLRRSRSV